MYNDIDYEALMKEECEYRTTHKCCQTCSNYYIEYGMSNCKKHDIPLEDEENDKCSDFVI